MPRVSCRRCGASFAKTGGGGPAADDYCCAGCALTSAVPVDSAGNFPITPAVIVALVTGFFYFNQVLFWSLSVLLAGQERTELAERTAIASGLAGVLVWVVAACAQWRVRGPHPADLTVLGFTAVAGVAGVIAGFGLSAVLANGMLLFWCGRGLTRKNTGKTGDSHLTG